MIMNANLSDINKFAVAFAIFNCFSIRFLMMSTEVSDLWDIIPVKVSGNNVAIGTEVPINDPFSFLHVWEVSVLGQPIDSIACLAKNERVSLIHDPLFILLLW